jgi:hypothetical protein
MHRSLARWYRAMHLRPVSQRVRSSHLPAGMHAVHGGNQVDHYRHRPMQQAVAMLSQRTARLLTRLVLTRRARDRWLVRLVTIHGKARTRRTYGSGCSPVVPPCPAAYGGLRMCRSWIRWSPEGVPRPLRAALGAAQGRPVQYMLLWARAVGSLAPCHASVSRHVRSSHLPAGMHASRHARRPWWYPSGPLPSQASASSSGYALTAYGTPAVTRLVLT